MDAITFLLPTSLDISIVNETKIDMVAQLQTDTPIPHINIDASQLSRVDTAGLQLLTALVIDINRQKINFTWQNVSDEIIQCAQRLGLNALLKLN